MIARLSILGVALTLSAAALAQTVTVTAAPSAFYPFTFSYRYTFGGTTSLYTATYPGTNTAPPSYFSPTYTLTAQTPTNFGGFTVGYRESISSTPLNYYNSSVISGQGTILYNVTYQGTPPPGVTPVNGTADWYTFPLAKMTETSYAADSVPTGTIQITALAPIALVGAGSASPAPVQRNWPSNVLLTYNASTTIWSGQMVMSASSFGANNSKSTGGAPLYGFIDQASEVFDLGSTSAWGFTAGSGA